MFGSLSVLLLAGLLAPTPQQDDALFHNYTQAYHTARLVKQPLLVILNPPAGSDKKPISIDDIRKTRHRRELLEKYVVVMIDTGTKHGRLCRELFKPEQLPEIVVIDKQQKFQIFQTSKKMYGQLWTKVLETYQTGELPTPVKPEAACPT